MNAASGLTSLPAMSKYRTVRSSSITHLRRHIDDTTRWRFHMQPSMLTVGLLWGADSRTMMSKPRSGSSAARNRRLALLFTAVVGLGFLFVRTCSGPPALAMHHDVLADASVLSATVVAGPAVCNVTRALEDFTLSPFSSDHREEIAPLLPALCTTECLKSTPAKGAAVTAAAPCPAAKPCSCPKASPCPSTNIPSVMKRPAPAVPGDLGVSTPGAVGGVEVVPQPLPPPVVLPPTNARTEFKCFQSSDWAEICVYNLLCMDGNKVVFIDDRKRPNEPVRRRASHQLPTQDADLLTFAMCRVVQVPSHYGVGDNPQGSHVFDVRVAVSSVPHPVCMRVLHTV